MSKTNILMADNRLYVSVMLNYDRNQEQRNNSTLTPLFCLIPLACGAGQGLKLANFS